MPSTQGIGPSDAKILSLMITISTRECVYVQWRSVMVKSTTALKGNLEFMHGYTSHGGEEQFIPKFCYMFIVLSAELHRGSETVERCEKL